MEKTPRKINNARPSSSIGPVNKSFKQLLHDNAPSSVTTPVKKKAVQSRSKDGEIEVGSSGVVLIEPRGNVILVCKEDETSTGCRFRVDSERLKENSRYFDRLLSNTGFSEGKMIASAMADGNESASSALPEVEVIDVGRISPVKSIRPLMTDLLVLLHQGRPNAKKVPLVNLANLAIACDRFDAMAVLAEFVRTSSVLLRPKVMKAPLDEASTRQRLLIGFLLDDEELVSVHSKDLILTGSQLWDSEISTELPNEALWWDLPRGLEEELQVRRHAVLDTVWSLISTCLSAYTSRTRQCRLGYDTSPQCDSFQLGEFVKFLVKHRFLDLSSMLALDRPQTYCNKDINEILATLKSCPSYQLDANHSHCGPRKQLLAGVRFINSCLSDQDIGICSDCWNDRTTQRRSWNDGSRTLAFDVAHASRERARWRALAYGHAAHTGGPLGESAARHFFTADEKLWNLEGTFGSEDADSGTTQSLRPTFGIK